ncbi:hypothetical protein P8625_00645 [Tenacibaculum tangerinum]|uniref:Contractile injection system tube protein N-terminal domain-containing protein n=1 Tax=Tenacibaculum tangerinum TaxID=3038772 RepID=A0ABY8L681_9FLAO|nr:hypothetical protein [Tenacibaculum tangerinum]WGH75703.1 hypothetical protein P8625_00645 [Tenacibaculum tangerinum]
MASLELMKITGYQDEDFNEEVSNGTYTVMLNPESVKWNRAIEYTKQQSLDAMAPSQKYKSAPAEQLSFDIVIDCTGIVDGKRTSMSKEITALESIVYTYNGKIHRPNFVKVQWGDISFNCVLTSLNTSYTLFKPDGSPLRAKISLSFDSYYSYKKRKKLESKSSPDMTHLVEVVEGDSLPQLCNRIWNSPDYYIQVAAYNKLNKFRQLTGGQQLIFPPIEKPVS